MSRKSTLATGLAAAVGVLGAFGTIAGTLYIAGMFGLSISFANQIITAVSVGGWLLAVVMGALSGGIASIVIATARWAILRWGKAVAAA